MTDELKPCPFCGCKATYAKAARGWKVECEGRMGSCTMNARTHYQPQKFLAIAAWNARADLAAPLNDPRVKALAEALRDMTALAIQLGAIDLETRDALAALSALENNK
jgi:hypothetical protein